MTRTHSTILTLTLAAWSAPAFAGDARITLAELAEQVEAADGASSEVKAFVKSALLPLSTDAALAAAVVAQNAVGTSLTEIQRIDREWIDAEDELPIHREKTSGACADRIRALTRTRCAVREAFVMDRQGAVVCENVLTGDYWQGDEAKWKKSFNDGRGGVDVGEEKLDRSTDTILQQVSLPILDRDGTVVGAVTWGIATGAL